MIDKFIFIYGYDCLHVSMCDQLIPGLWGPEEGDGFPESRVSDGCEPQYGCGGLNGPIPQGQQVLLTVWPSL